MQSPYTAEELELIRLLCSDKMRILKNRIHQYETDLKISEANRPKYLEKTRNEFAQLALIEAKAMKEISKTFLSEN